MPDIDDNTTPDNSYQSPDWDALTERTWADPQWRHQYRPNGPLPGDPPHIREKYGYQAPRTEENYQLIDMTRWSIHDDLPDLKWTVPDRLLAGHVCLFSGHGGTGKSTLALQLCAAHALARDWNTCLPVPGPTLFIDAEDGEDIIRRRLIAIGRHYQVDFPDLIAGGLNVMSLAGRGQEAVIATTGRGNQIAPTKLHAWIEREVLRIKPVQIVIASAANVFSGDENIRAPVTQFISLLTGLALAGGDACSLILISHPSLSGMNSGSGISGSTQWFNGVRAQWYLDKAAGGVRNLSCKKNQYGPDAADVALEWRNGLFLPPAAPTAYEQAAKIARAEELIAEAMGSEQNFSPNRLSRTYLPRVVLGNAPDGHPATLADLESALKQMLDSGRLKIEEYGPPSQRSARVVLAS